MLPCVLYQAVSLAVSSAQHQNAPPAGSSHPDGGVGMDLGVGGLPAQDMSSAFEQHAPLAGLEQEDAAADAAETGNIETSAAATAPSVGTPPAESISISTKAVRSGEPSPAGIDEESDALSESRSLGDRDAALLSSMSSSSFGVSPTTKAKAKTGKEQTKTLGSDSGPWAFAAAAADSEHSGGGGAGASAVRD